MNKNVGSTDRAIRYLLGALMLAAGLFLEGSTQYAAWGVGVVVLLTAHFRFCGIYTLFGISTCPKDFNGS